MHFALTSDSASQMNCVDICPNGIELQAEIAAAKEEERLPFRKLGGFDFADNDGVVTSEMRGIDGADELRENSVEQRHAGFGPVKTNAEAGFVAGFLFDPSEKFREQALIVAQDADAKLLAFLEQRKKAGANVHADGNKRWIQGDGGEGISGHAVNFTGCAFHGDDRNASGKCTERLTKFERCERADGHSPGKFKITYREKPGVTGGA